MNLHIRVPLIALLSGAVATAVSHTQAAALPIDLTTTDTVRQWRFSDTSGKIVDGEMILDGRKRYTSAFFLPHEFGDVTLTAKFRVEPRAEGVLACGFIARAADTVDYYYVHFARNAAILVRHGKDDPWNEIKRASVPREPLAGWHEGKLECHSNVLRVSFDGKLLFEAQDAKLSRGRIGFYGIEGLVHIKDIVVAGTPLKPERELVFPPVSYVTVCADAGAGGYEAFPDVCRLRDERLMVVFYAGYGHVALPNDQLPRGGRICYCTSRDEGRTWSPAQVLVDTPDDDRDPSIVQLKSGRLICNFFRLRKSATGYDGLGTWIVTSDNLGRTWSEPRQISRSYYASSPIRELTDGRLILGLYMENEKTARGAAIFSDDGGKTWGKEVDIDNGGLKLDAETDIIELRDGRLYAAQRPKMSYAISSDRGATWSVSKPIGFAGHCPYFLRTRDNIILLAHRLPGTSLHYSLDECSTWSENVLIDEAIGAYPSMVNLKDGSVLVVYYEEGEGSNILAKRFRATRQGVKWLPLK